MNFDKYLKRASVRRFDGRPVPMELLRNILEAASHAPTTGNMQLYSVVVSTEPEDRKRLAALHFNQPAATGAPLILTVCADVHRHGAWCDARSADRSMDNAGGRLTAITDAIIFAQQLVAVAEDCGLGTCYLGSVSYNLRGFAQELQLPAGVIPVVSIAMGYAADPKPEAADRLPLEAFVHYGKYSAPTPADIDGFYAAREALESNRQFTQENGKETLAQVFAAVRYPRHLNEDIGRQMLDMLD